MATAAVAPKGSELWLSSTVTEQCHLADLVPFEFTVIRDLNPKRQREKKILDSPARAQTRNNVIFDRFLWPLLRC